MAQQPEDDFYNFQTVELFTSQSLGSGSYGAVCKAMCDDLPCAAKIIHPTLLEFSIPGTTLNLMQKFEQECRLLSAINHPHIVQYLGTCYDPESKLPVLLMELMDESLTRFLERSHEPLPYHTEVNLCHDIALALSYLHSNGIVHRDLSSNNVLLIAGSRAKVTDFGMVKLYDVNQRHHTPLTLCPGTTVYMSPEALRDQPVYTDKLDTFSFGVLCIQIMTRKFPDPTNRVVIVEDSRFPTGKVEVPIPETERRQSHISMIDPAHPLLPVALTCLQDEGGERPSAQEICRGIATLKTATCYQRSVQLSQERNAHSTSGDQERQIRELKRQLAQQAQSMQTLQSQVHARNEQQEIQEQQRRILRLRNVLTATNEQLQTLQQQITTKDEQLADQAEELAYKDQQLQQLQAGVEEELAGMEEDVLRELAAKDQQLQHKEAVIAARQQEIQQLRQQLQSSEQVTAEFQQNLLERERQIREMRQQHTQQVQTLQLQLQSKNEQLLAKDKQLRTHLQQKEQKIQQQQQQIQTLQNWLTATNDQLQKDQQLQQKQAACEQEIQQLRQQLQFNEQVTADFQQKLLEREKTIRNLRQQHTQQVQTLQLQLQSKDKQLLAKDKQLLTHLRQREQEIQQQEQPSHPLQDLPTATSDQLQTLQQQTTKDKQLAAEDQQKEAVIETAIAARQQEIWQLREQLQSSEQVTAEFQQNLLEREEIIQDPQKEAVIKTVTAARQQEIQQLRQQLQSSVQVTAEFQRNFLEREKTIQDQTQEPQQQPRQRGVQRQKEVDDDGWEVVDVSGAVAREIKLQWKDGGRAPRRMWGKVAAVNGSVALFRSDEEVYSYNSSNKKWSQLPKCPNYGFSLAIVNTHLTAIGGKTPNEQVTNSLLCLAGSKWVEWFFPMPTKRWLTAVVCSGKSLVVAGGIGRGCKRLSTVEVMNAETLQWSSASSLPHPLSEASATLFEGNVYMLGGQNQDHAPSKSVFSCSVAALFQSCQSLVARLKTLSLASRPKVWCQLADTPDYLSTCALLHGQLLAVGGRDSDDKATTAIHMYKPTTDSWKVISDMATPRYRCLVAVFPHDKLMIVGGCTSNSTIDSVEIATLV